MLHSEVYLPQPVDLLRIVDHNPNLFKQMQWTKYLNPNSIVQCMNFSWSSWTCNWQIHSQHLQLENPNYIR
jgi:hypothetical protein